MMRKGPDAKILTVPARDPWYAVVQDLGDVPEHLAAEIGHFFDIYKELEPGKSTDVRGWQDRASARGMAAAALFRPSMGGWIVRIFPGGIRRHPSRAVKASEATRPGRIT
jgi:Inorganic pyrophosphatase